MQVQAMFEPRAEYVVEGRRSDETKAAEEADPGGPSKIQFEGYSPGGGVSGIGSSGFSVTLSAIIEVSDSCTGSLPSARF